MAEYKNSQYHAEQFVQEFEQNKEEERQRLLSKYGSLKNLIDTLISEYKTLIDACLSIESDIANITKYIYYASPDGGRDEKNEFHEKIIKHSAINQILSDFKKSCSLTRDIIRKTGIEFDFSPLWFDNLNCMRINISVSSEYIPEISNVKNFIGILLGMESNRDDFTFDFSDLRPAE